MKLSEKVKKEIVENISKENNIIKIILFGSYAYGEPNINSDIDLIIIEDKFESKIKELKKIRKLLRDIDYAKDIIILNNEEFEFYKNEFGSVYKEAYEKGEILYEKVA